MNCLGRPLEQLQRSLTLQFVHLFVITDVRFSIVLVVRIFSLLDIDRWIVLRLQSSDRV
jgi:hypothetical protein